MVFRSSSSFEFFYFRTVDFLVPPARLYIDVCYSRSMSLRYRSFLDAGVLQRLAEAHSPGIEVFQTYIQISSCFGDRL